MQRQKIIAEVELRKGCGQSSVDVHPTRSLPPASPIEMMAAHILTQIKSDPTVQGDDGRRRTGDAQTQTNGERLADRVNRIETENGQRDAQIEAFAQTLRNAGLWPAAPTNATPQSQQTDVSEERSGMTYMLPNMSDTLSNMSDEQTETGDEQTHTSDETLQNDEQSQGRAQQTPPDDGRQGIIAPVPSPPPMDMPLFPTNAAEAAQASRFMDHIEQRPYPTRRPQQHGEEDEAFMDQIRAGPPLPIPHCRPQQHEEDDVESDTINTEGLSLKSHLRRARLEDDEEESDRSSTEARRRERRARSLRHAELESDAIMEDLE